jgi:hypothetical protein
MDVIEDELNNLGDVADFMSADSQVDGLMVNKDEGCAALIGRIF